MPIDARFDADNRLLQVTIGDTWPTLPEVLAERTRLIERGLLHPGIVGLIDARAVSRGIPNLSQMREILGAVGQQSHKCAIVVTTSVQLKAGRLAELLDPEGLRVFSDECSARAWLLGPARPHGWVELDRSLSGRVAVVWS